MAPAHIHTPFVYVCAVVFPILLLECTDLTDKKKTGRGRRNSEIPREWIKRERETKETRKRKQGKDKGKMKKCSKGDRK
jgi:hypothetical protein